MRSSPGRSLNRSVEEPGPEGEDEARREDAKVCE